MQFDLFVKSAHEINFIIPETLYLFHGFSLYFLDHFLSFIVQWPILIRNSSHMVLEIGPLGLRRNSLLCISVGLEIIDSRFFINVVIARVLPIGLLLQLLLLLLLLCLRV